MIDVLVIGGDSIIGKALYRELEATGQTITVTSRRENHRPTDVFLDLTKPDRDWPMLPKAKVWVLAAAVTRLAACREDPEASHQINVVAVESLVKQAAAQGAQVIFLSSDKIFDGSRPHRLINDEPCPLSEYGRQKACAEKIVLNASRDNLVIRLTKVLSPGDALLRSWRDSLMQDEPIASFTDMTLAPVSIETVIIGISRAITQKISGILQFSGPEDVSYATTARHYAILLGARLENVTPANASKRGIPAEERPTFTSLDTARATEALSVEFAPLNALLENMLGHRQSQHANETSNTYGG